MADKPTTLLPPPPPQQLSLDAEMTDQQGEAFGKDTTRKRPSLPSEVAPASVFLAAADSTYPTGRARHPNGGETGST